MNHLILLTLLSFSGSDQVLGQFDDINSNIVSDEVKPEPLGDIDLASITDYTIGTTGMPTTSLPASEQLEGRTGTKSKTNPVTIVPNQRLRSPALMKPIRPIKPEPVNGRWAQILHSVKPSSPPVRVASYDKTNPIDVKPIVLRPPVLGKIKPTFNPSFNKPTHSVVKPVPTKIVSPTTTPCPYESELPLIVETNPITRPQLPVKSVIVKTNPITSTNLPANVIVAAPARTKPLVLTGMHRPAGGVHGGSSFAVVKGGSDKDVHGGYSEAVHGGSDKHMHGGSSFGVVTHGSDKHVHGGSFEAVKGGSDKHVHGVHDGKHGGHKQVVGTKPHTHQNKFYHQPTVKPFGHIRTLRPHFKPHFSTYRPYKPFYTSHKPHHPMKIYKTPKPFYTWKTYKTTPKLFTTIPTTTTTTTTTTTPKPTTTTTTTPKPTTTTTTTPKPTTTTTTTPKPTTTTTTTCRPRVYRKKFFIHYNGGHKGVESYGHHHGHVSSGSHGVHHHVRKTPMYHRPAHHNVRVDMGIPGFIERLMAVKSMFLQKLLQPHHMNVRGYGGCRYC